MANAKTLRIEGYAWGSKNHYTVHYSEGGGVSLKVFDTRAWRAPQGTLSEAIKFALGFKGAHPQGNEVEIFLSGSPLARVDLAYGDGIRAAQAAFR